MNCLVQGREININKYSEGDYLYIEILDNGFGLTLEDMQKYEKKAILNDVSYTLNWEEIVISIKEHKLDLEYQNTEMNGGKFILKISKNHMKSQSSESEHKVYYLNKRK